MHFKKQKKLFLSLALSLGIGGVLMPTTVQAEGKQFDTNNIPDYLIYKDADGNYIDLGGIEVTIRDWWSTEDAASISCNDNMGEGYLDWIQQTYNFTIKTTAISDWGGVINDFIDYVYAGGDNNNYVFTLRNDPKFSKAVFQGICYDLSKLNCLKFDQEKFTANKISEQYSIGHEIYATYSGPSEPRGGLFFNKQLLIDAGVDPESIYDMQADGTWTWDKFEEILAKVQRDIDGDGLVDVMGLTGQPAIFTNAAVASNNAFFIGQDETHHYVYQLENPNTVAAIDFANKITGKYCQKEPLELMHHPEKGDEIYHEWDFYKAAFPNNEAAFLIEDAYAVVDEEYINELDVNYLVNTDGQYGYVAFPKGPNATTYNSVWSNNLYVIPACYDDERAWKIAFAWNLFTNYTDDDAWKLEYIPHFGDDTRAINETLNIMRQNGHIDFHDLIPGIETGPDLLWSIGDELSAEDLVNGAKGKWQKAVDKANANVDKKLATQTYEDVNFGDWYVKAVQFVMDNDIMTGKGKKSEDATQEIFDPETPLTRAEFVTVLYNKEKKPDAPVEQAFEDVDNKEWYADAVAWAHANKIVAGYEDGTFGVKDKITREQLAQMLYNYAIFRGYNISVDNLNTDMNRFADSDSITDWAEKAMTWVTAKGIMNGDTAEKPHLNPLGNAKRSECASLVQKFMEVQGEETAK